MVELSSAAAPGLEPPGPAVAPPDEMDAAFDEETYLRFNPDVRNAVASGAFRSGRDHYERYGRAEGRPYKMLDPLSRNQVVVTGVPGGARELPTTLACVIDTMRLSRSGGIFIAGWVNDAADPLDSIDLYFGGWSVSFEAASLARVRRADAEAALKAQGRHAHGFWGFINAGQALPPGQCSLVVRLQSGNETAFVVPAGELTDDADLRDHVLATLAGGAYFGNFHFEATASIDRFIGDQLIAFNKLVSRHALSVPFAEIFSGGRRRYRGSIVVCLYGRPEYMFLQNAMFARQPGIEDYEFIYVCNSPDIAEALLKEARLCRHIYGLDLTVVILAGNAGFGPANNLACRYARSDRLLITNPDVFPCGPDWVARHSAVVSEMPQPRTNLFGAPLYYDDGSLMHGGMYFESDTMPRFNGPKTEASRLLRVEHYGKGAPPATPQFLKARPVPAVSGAFISAARPWFEKLGGFSDDYVFGHYEDADLCLKSLAAGCAPWLHDVKLWHLEGKGSTRRAEHEGGSIINRWLFTRKWVATLQQGLLGPAPTHPGLAMPGAKPGGGLKMAAGKTARP